MSCEKKRKSLSTISFNTVNCGILSLPVLTCADPVPTVDNASVSGSGNTFASQRTYTCYVGHEFDGGHQQETSSCTNVNDSGVWSYVPDSCESK